MRGSFKNCRHYVVLWCREEGEKAAYVGRRRRRGVTIARWKCYLGMWSATS
jgi:hypothetical protein